MSPHEKEPAQQMRVVTSAQMAELDRRATERYGIPVERLMETAGRRVAQAAVELVPGSRGPVTVLVGKGHNGGDGLVAARQLASRGISVVALLVADEMEYSGEAGRTLGRAREAGVRVIDTSALATGELPRALSTAALIVDALFGTGFRGPVRGPAAALIDGANNSKKPVLSVDIPSGLNADTGQADGPVVRALATVTMGLPKVGLLVPPGIELAGTTYIADIGYPPELADESSIATHLVTGEMVRTHIPARPFDSHKGTFGKTFLIAGSVGFTGAPVLAALGALRIGAGLVTLAAPRTVYPIVASHVIEAMPTPLDDDGGGALAASALARVEELAAASDVVAVGPGLGTAPGVRRVVEGLLASEKPLVVDADALNVFAGQPEKLRRAAGPTVITPHPGELARLLGTQTRDVLTDRLTEARRTAERLRCVVVLKSASTVVATPEGDAFFVLTGNPGMATGGMGDVLTGAIASLIGQGIPPAEAAWTAAYLHGMAADLIAEERGMAGMLASEVAHYLPAAIGRVLRGEFRDAIRLLRD